MTSNTLLKVATRNREKERRQAHVGHVARAPLYGPEEANDVEYPFKGDDEEQRKRKKGKRMSAT